MYKIILQTGEVIRDADSVVVAPCQSVDDPNYVAYLEWVEQGNEPVVGDYVPPRYVPQEVTPRQIRLALNALGLRQVIESAVAAGSQDLKDTWEFSTVIERFNPLIGAMAGSLGMSDEQVDELFILAATM